MSPILPLLALAPLAAAAPEPDGSDPRAELSAFWAGAARTVAEGDFAGYAALYHPDAVFVRDGEGPGGAGGVAVPIADQLETWRPGFEATRAGEVAAAVEFRFTRRTIGPAAAHETGVFRYVSHPPGEPGEPALVRFEALLVKTPAGWRWVLERQLGPATAAQWAAAAPAGGG